MDNAAQIVLQTTEAEVVPGQTARYPFTVRTSRRLPAVTEFGVRSDNPWFDPRWARVVRATDQHRVTRYLLEITPDHVHHDQYGRYPLQLSWASAFTGAWCVLVIKPGEPLQGGEQAMAPWAR